VWVVVVVGNEARRSDALRFICGEMRPPELSPDLITLHIAFS